MLKFNWPTTGNEDRLAELENDLLNERMNHAYLFTGVAEVGKLTAAKFFAKLILCENNACDVCEVCQKIRANIHPQLTIADKLWIEGVNENFEQLAKKTNFNQSHRARTPKSKTDTIRLNDLREILARIHTSHDKQQIFVIHDIERMNRESSNFFLKTLEEPPPQTIFLLTTSNQPLLLPTIISRCRVLYFGNVSPPAIEKMITREFPCLDEEKRMRVVNFSMGKPVRAAKLASDPEIFREFTEYFRKITTLLEKPNPANKMFFAEKITETPTEIQKFFEAFTHFLRSFLLSRTRQPIDTSRYSAKKIVELLRATNISRKLVFDKNVNPRLVIENLLLQI